MAEKLYKVDEVIEFGYQAPNKESGLTVLAEIYLPNKAKDAVNFPDVTLVEIGSSGTYRGEFTPNAQGTWQLIIHKDDGEGQVTKAFSVGGHNVDSVGEAVVGINSAVATVDGKVDTTIAGVASVDGKADTINTKADDIITKIDEIDNKVGGLDTPPMAF